MLNHPHDCPVCDEGGECHLQDMTVMTGHDYRRTRFEKRTFHDQYLGPFVYHEMNRCIQCYRCVRFYREYAGGNDLNSFGIRECGLFRPRRRWSTRERVRRQSGGSLPYGRFYRSHAPAPLHAQMGSSHGSFDLRPLQRRLQRDHRRALWASAPGPDPVQQRGERLLPLRPRAFWLRIRKQRPTNSRRKAGRRVYFERRGGAAASVSRFERQPADRYRLAQSLA